MEAVTDLAAVRQHRACYAAEQDILAACVLTPEKLHTVSLDPRHFTEGPNRHIWETLLALQAEGEPIDTVFVLERLDAAGYREDGTYLLTLLAEHNPANFAEKVRLVWQHAQKREFWEQLERAYRKRDEAEIVRIGEEIQLRLAEGSRRPTLASVDVAYQSMVDEWAAERERPKMTWGISRMDRAVRGIQPTRLIIIGARPRMGKTAMAIHIALANARAGRSVGIISVEQSMEELTARMLCNLSQRPMDWVTGESRAPQPDIARIDEAKQEIRRLPIVICDQTPMTIGQCAGWARTLVHRRQCEMIIVDYVQKLSGRAQERHREVGEVVSGLKDIARQLKVPVVALAQMNRDAEGRRPTMADLKDSGAIEQEADIIVGLHRDEDKDTGELSSVTELLVLKNRHGRADMRGEAWYRGECFRFEDVEGRYAK